MARTVCKENQCTGCMACLEACGQDAITIKDELRYYNALIDSNKCIDCGACDHICQNNNEIKTNEPIVWYQGWSKSEKQRKISSSGGFAAELAKYFVEIGGIVCSCIFENGVFGFAFADSVESVMDFAGSKYVKSNPKGIYKEIRRLLRKNQRIMFIGLPCQAAAVKLFVGEKLWDNLYLVDLICHGTPSPKNIELFLREAGYEIKDLKSIGFRKKDVFRVVENEHYVDYPGIYDCYSLAFLNCINYTDNCFSCKYANRKRVSDITIGDSWGSELAKEEQKKGISLALCQTEKGKELLKNANVELFPVSIEKAISHNHQLERPSDKPPRYESFFDALEKGKTYKTSVKIGLPRTYHNQQIKKFLMKLGLLNGGGYTVRVITKA